MVGWRTSIITLIALALLADVRHGCQGWRVGSAARRAPSPHPHRAEDPNVTIGTAQASWHGEPKIVSWRPFVMVFENFLSDFECDYLLNKSQPLMEPAMLVNSMNAHFRSKRRTSHGAFFDRGEDAVIAAIDERIAHATFLPAENAEPLQVMTYSQAERYTAHVDYYHGNRRYFGTSVEVFGGQRIATVLLYLTTCAGGETVFPRAAKHNAVGRNSCAEKGLGVKTVKGRMVVFHNIHPNGTPNNASLHESCPVLNGQKTVISRFIRSHKCPLNKNFSKRKWNGNVDCVDDHEQCAEMAAKGACTSAAKRLFMAGNDTLPGFCEKTCNACTHPVEPSVLELRAALHGNIASRTGPQRADGDG